MDEKRNKDFPYEIELLNPVDNPELAGYLQGDNEYYVRIGPKKYFYQGGYASEAANIYNLPLRSDDIFIATNPKSGTTLTQELVWLLCNNLDYKKAQSIVLNERVPFLELSPVLRITQLSLTEDQIEMLKKNLVPKTPKEIEEIPSPRFIKTHLPLSLLPPSLLDITKVIYVTRDPRDVAVSFYHHHKLTKMSPPDLKFKHFWNNFVSDNVVWCPYFAHVLEAWEKRNHPNLLFLFYEDMTKDLAGAILRVANFLDKTLTDEELNGLVDHLGFENFKKNKSVNMGYLQESGIFTDEGGFIRKGKSGGWRDYFDEEMTAQAEEWIEKNIRGTDFRFPHC